MAGDSWVFNAHDSVLWCNVRDLRAEEVKSLHIRLAGQGTGYTFQGIVPSLTYIKVPVFEAGQRLVELACEYVNGDGQLNMNGRNSLPVELELNESTSGCR